MLLFLFFLVPGRSQSQTKGNGFVVFIQTISTNQIPQRAIPETVAFGKLIQCYLTYLAVAPHGKLFRSPKNDVFVTNTLLKNFAPKSPSKTLA